MFPWSILVAAVLFTLAVLLLADVFRPMLRLHLTGTAPGTQHRDADRRYEVGVEETHAASGHCVSGLSEGDREGFCLVWKSVRQEFDTDPAVAIVHADLLIADLIEYYRCSVASPAGPLAEGEIKTDYERAHQVALRSKQGFVERVELERAIGVYTVVFDELVGARTGSATHRRAA